MRQLGAFGDNRHAGAVLRPHLPQVGRILPQGAGGFIAEDGGGGSVALCDVAEGEAVTQAFVEDVLLCLGDQPRRDLIVVNRRAKQRLVVGKPDVAVHGSGHFQQRCVKARDGALKLVGEVLQYAVKDAFRLDDGWRKTAGNFAGEGIGEGVMRRRLRAVEDAKLDELVVVQLGQVCAELGGNRRFLFGGHDLQSGKGEGAQLFQLRVGLFFFGGAGFSFFFNQFFNAARGVINRFIHSNKAVADAVNILG